MRALSLLSLLSVAGFALACAGGPDDEAATTPKAAPTPVSTSAAVTRDVPRTLTVTGSLIAVEDADVAAEAAGAVQRIAADRGDLVNKGDALLLLDTATSGLQAKEAAASVAAAEVQVKQAEADCARARTLTDAGGLSTAERDRLLSQCEQGARQLEAAKARLALANTNLARGTVRAPFAGVVAERMVSPGEYVTPGRAVVKLVAVDPLRLELSVPERAASQVKQGASVTFTVTDHPERTFTATIDRVSPALRERTRDLVVEATVQNTDGALRPNSFVVAKLALPDAPGVTVPLAALHESGDVTRLYVATDNTAEERVVEVGARLADAAEIRVGVKDGERVISPIPEGLADGATLAAQ
ncbi:MAG: efflux RND transporter periplasmic adaptor subunit [Pseudomonadota bacterium]|nr:efflux RND transporter periplasmic adaptor subunit [Pseudomonadota bacterium]